MFQVLTRFLHRNVIIVHVVPAAMSEQNRAGPVPRSERDIAELYFNRRVSAPFRVICEVTYRCNAHCIHCYAPPPEPYITELTFQEWKDVLQDISDMGAFRVIFTGGEALLRKDIFDMIAWAHELGLLTFLETNGSLINRENAENLVNAGIDVVNISINRCTPSDYDAFSGFKGLFNRAVTALKTLNTYPVETSVFTTITKVNIKEIPDIIDLAASLGVNRIAFVHISPAGRAQPGSDLFPSAQEYIDVLNHIHEKDEQYPDLVIKYPNLPAFYFQESIGLEAYDRVKNHEGYIELCTAGITGYVIDPAGNVKPCTVTSGITLGNVRTDSLKTLWLSSPVLECLRNVEKSTETPCNTCTLNNICVAGHRCLDYQLEHLASHRQSVAAPLCQQCYQYMTAKDQH